MVKDNYHHNLIFITGLAAVLRLSTLTVESLWYDEVFTAWLAALPVPDLIRATLGDVHPPTWYLIEWGMVRLLGNTELGLRLVSALAGVALIPAVYRLARAFEFGRDRSLAAAGLAAVAPFVVYYSQEARAYALIFLLTTIATIALLERRWWLLILSASLALWLHNLVVLYVTALVWLALFRWRLDWRMLLSFAVIGIIWLPWVIWGLVGQVGDVQNGFWTRPPTLGTPIFILTAWLFSAKAFLLVLVTVPILSLALVHGLANTPGPARIQLLGLLLIPLGLGVIISVLVAPVLVDRVIGSSAVALYLLIAPALIPTRWPPPRRWAWPTVERYALPALFFLTLTAHYTAFYGLDSVGRYPWDYGLDRFMLECRPGDAIFHANLATYMVYSHYLPDIDQAVWRQANDLSQSLTNKTKLAMGISQAQFEDIACHHPRWWLAFYENPTTSDQERDEVARIVAQYGGELRSTMFKNDLAHARLYLVRQPCARLAKK